MTKVTDLPEIDAIADNDYLYVWDASDPGSPDKKIPRSKLRATGAKITNYIRFAGVVTIPNLAAGVEADATITVTGALVGDNVLFNLSALLPANIGMFGAAVTAADTVRVRFRNLHASVAFSTADIACVALVVRHTA